MTACLGETAGSELRETARGFPWREAMAVGLGTLRLSPREFWKMTPRELDAALRGLFGMGGARSGPGAKDLAALMQRYPDRRKGKA